VKYFPLVWAALRRRKARSLLTLLSIVTAFFLFGALQGFNVGINSAFNLVNVAHLVVMSRVSMNDPMPVAHAARIAAVKGVTAVTPINFVFGSYQRPTDIEIMIGVDLPALLKINSDITVPPDQVAALLRTRSGVIVGRALADKKGWKIGDRIPIHSLNMVKSDGSSNWTFDVVGFYDVPHQREFAARIWANYDYINEARASGKDTAVQFYVGVKDAAQSAQIAQTIDDMFANSPDQTVTQNEKEYFQSIMRQIGDIGFLVNAIVGAVFFTLLFLTANTMAQSVRERIPELAVLKTLGFTDAGVQWLVLAEALLLALIAAALGLALAALVLPLATSGLAVQGIGAMHVPRPVFAAGIALAVLLALVSGVPPAARARRLRIAAALSGR
jgi:putative ABC transport system permease protein